MCFFQSWSLKFFRENGYGLYGYPLVGGQYIGPLSGYYGYLFQGISRKLARVDFDGKTKGIMFVSK